MSMGLFARFVLLARGKFSAGLDRAEDPREVLEYGYQQQQREFVKVKRSLVEVATARAQVELQARKLHERVPYWAEQAQRALELGREDFAREALQRKHAAIAELETLAAHVAEVGEEEARLTSAQHKLAARIEEFRGRKGIISARYSSAEARVRAADALTGISGEMAELNLALGRAEEKTERLQARAGALDALIESDALAPAWGSADALGQELRQLVSAQTAEAELEVLKRQLVERT
jgi:phage shock protein A